MKAVFAYASVVIRDSVRLYFLPLTAIYKAVSRLLHSLAPNGERGRRRHVGVAGSARQAQAHAGCR